MTTVAATILAQLGGNKFIAMTGAKRLVSDVTALCVQLPARFARDGINAVCIILDVASDTYTMRFTKQGRAPKYSTTVIAMYDGLHAEDLRRVFTSVTGLETSLGTLGA